MKTIHRLLVSAAIVMTTPGLSIAALSAKDELIFKVSLDDKPIGVHRFRISDEGAMRVVDSEASFDVRILGVPVYRYRHSNSETWENGCLKRIDSETDANGTPYAVDLSKTAMGYRIVTPSETQTYEGDCLMSFAYWDRRCLQQQRLLNTQTGELITVEILSLGESQRQVANQMLSVQGSAGCARTRFRPAFHPEMTVRTFKSWLIVPIALLLIACQTTPMNPITTVKQVDLERFMGDWYVIANLPTFIERDAYNAVESYRLTDEGTVATTFTFRRGCFDGER